MVVALTVTLTVCDAHRIGLSTSLSLVAPMNKLVRLQSKRHEQKAPRSFVLVRATTETFASRQQGLGSHYLDGSQYSQYALISLARWPNPFCLRLNSCQTTRAPPLMDPPTLC